MFECIFPAFQTHTLLRLSTYVSSTFVSFIVAIVFLNPLVNFHPTPGWMETNRCPWKYENRHAKSLIRSFKAPSAAGNNGARAELNTVNPPLVKHTFSSLIEKQNPFDHLCCAEWVTISWIRLRLPGLETCLSQSQSETADYPQLWLSHKKNKTTTTTSSSGLFWCYKS